MGDNLIKIEKMILKKAQKNNKEFFESTVLGNTKFSDEQIYVGFKSLEEKGYMKEVDTSIDYKRTTGFLTLKGMFFKEYQKNEILEKIFSSVILPILISVITSIIISGIM